MGFTEIGRVDDERLYLQQVNGSLEHRITLIHDQLKEMLEFLANPSEGSHVASGQPEDILLRIFDAEDSFSVTQGDHQLIGFGDIRRVLEPVADNT